MHQYFFLISVSVYWARHSVYNDIVVIGGAGHIHDVFIVISFCCSCWNTVYFQAAITLCQELAKS